jgi:hypothetical protein
MMGFSCTRLLAIAVLLAAPASAQTRPYPPDMTTDEREEQTGANGDEGTFSLKPGLGFTASPTSLLLGFEGDYRVADPISLGALTEVGIRDHLTIVSPVLFARYWPNLGRLIDPDLSPIEPYLHLGLGFSYWDADGYRGVHDNDTEFLLNMGFGVEYRFTKHVSVGSQMLFNVIPAGELEHTRIDKTFYFSWQVVGLRYRF